MAPFVYEQVTTVTLASFKNVQAEFESAQYLLTIQ